MKPLQIGALCAPKPIIQGGMGIGISLSRLAGAVARCGGIGVLSAAQIGFREPDFKQSPKEANLRAMRSEIARARELAQGGVLGINIMVAMKDYEEYVRAAVENGIDLIISGAGLPTELPRRVAGSEVKIAPILSTAKAARTLLKLWSKRHKRTADLIVVEGPLAGGHLGFSEEDLARFTKEEYEKELIEILSIVQEYEQQFACTIPVVFAGGVFDRTDIEYYLSLGFSGVQMASRFVVTEECDASDAFKQAYLHARETDIVIKRSPVGMLGRAIQTPMLVQSMQSRIAPKHCTQCLADCDRAHIPYCITEALSHAALGDIHDALVFCGARVGEIDRITTVRELMEELS